MKLLFSTIAVVFFLSAFSSQATAQNVRYYKTVGEEGKFKIEFTGDHTNEKVWFKKTQTSVWEARNVTYSDEEIIKYKVISNNQAFINTLVFPNGNIDYFIINYPNGAKKRYDLVE